MLPSHPPAVSRPRRLTAAAAIGAVLVALAGHLPASTRPVTVPDDTIDQVISDMSVEELIGQMTWTHVYGAAGDDTSRAGDNQARYGVATPAEVVEKYHLGGVLYFAWAANTQSPEQVADLSADLQQAASGTGPAVPLAITVDQEGGEVSRIGPPATALPGGMALGATFDADLAHAQGEALGSELAAMGINVDFAPVVDLNSNPANPVIGLRSMGDDPDLVAELGAAEITGLQSQHVAAAAKHFPGHGDTDVDSHTGLPVVSGDPDTLAKHLEPFRTAIEAGVDIIMSAHIIVQAIDPDLPGTLSPAVLTDLLRGDLDFQGLVTTDALDMQALKQLPDNPLDDADIAALAVEAGSDILLDSPNLDASFAGIHAALDSGDLTRERLEESVRRILQWKSDRGVWAPDGAEPDVPGLDTVGSAEHTATATAISEHAATLLRNEGGIVPLDPASTNLLVAGAGSAGTERLAPLLAAQGFTVDDVLEGGDSPSGAYRSRAVAAAADVDTVVVVVDNALHVAAQQQLVTELAAGPTPVVVVLAGTPYDLATIDEDPTAVLATYGGQRVNFQGAAAVLAGTVDPTGRLPVDVPHADGLVLAEFGVGLRTTTEVTPEPVTFTDEVGTADDSITVQDVDGVSYLIDGTAVAPGSHPASGDVVVTAVADAAFHLAPDAAAEWTHSFAAQQQASTPDENGSTSSTVPWLVVAAVLAGVAAAVAVVVVIVRRRRRD